MELEIAMLRMDFWSRFHRFFRFSFEHVGICFDHGGDEVVWIWPWKRENRTRKYISTGFNAVFHSLKEIDNLWKDYFKAMEKQ